MTDENTKRLNEIQEMLRKEPMVDGDKVVISNLIKQLLEPDVVKASLHSALELRFQEIPL